MYAKSAKSTKLKTTNPKKKGTAFWSVAFFRPSRNKESMNTHADGSQQQLLQGLVSWFGLVVWDSGVFLCNNPFHKGTRNQKQQFVISWLVLLQKNIKAHLFRVIVWWQSPQRYFCLNGISIYDKSCFKFLALPMIPAKRFNYNHSTNKFMFDYKNDWLIYRTWQRPVYYIFSPS